MHQPETLVGIVEPDIFLGLCAVGVNRYRVVMINDKIQGSADYE